MPVDLGVAMNLFVAVSLLVISATLLIGGRRRPEHLILTLFLTLVSLNFFAAAADKLAPSSFWVQANVVTNGLDPFFLLLFVTAYPYVRRPRGVKLLLVLIGAAAVASVLIAVLRPALVQPVPHVNLAESPGRHVVLGQLALAYASAWFLALRSWQEAPTRQLAQRAAWLVTAVGVAMIPRLALLPVDYGWGPLLLFASAPHDTVPLKVAAILLNVGLALLIMGLLFFVGIRSLRRAEPERAPTLAGSLRFIGMVLGLIIVARVFYETGIHFGLALQSGHAIFYVVRWVLFAVILVYGILAYDVLEFRRASETVVPLLGGVLGALFVFLVTAVLVARFGAPDIAIVPLSIATALGSAVPAGALARAVARNLVAARGPDEQTERRLELYRAALEAAWARGPPSAEERRQLEKDRRAFGASVDEARALEHALATQAAAGPPPLKPGDEPVTGLVIERVLGEGAHGRVFAAWRHPTGERVVVKEFHTDRLGRVESRRRLLKELRALQGLDHPNLVRFLDVQIIGGHQLLILEFVDGQSLSARLAKGPIPPTQVRSVLGDVLGGLGAAHRKGIVHRDLKPSNILIDSQGRARLTDFGVAALRPDLGSLRETVATLGELEAFAGTLPYMAPEQVRGGPVGPWTDLYALGLVAYEALVGRPPFDLRGHSLLEALELVAQPRINLGRVPASWHRILNRALDPRPNHRFGSAAEMRAALEAMREKSRPREAGSGRR